MNSKLMAKGRQEKKSYLFPGILYFYAYYIDTKLKDRNIKYCCTQNVYLHNKENCQYKRSKDDIYIYKKNETQI